MPQPAVIRILDQSCRLLAAGQISARCHVLVTCLANRWDRNWNRPVFLTIEDLMDMTGYCRTAALRARREAIDAGFMTKVKGGYQVQVPDADPNRQTETVSRNDNDEFESVSKNDNDEFESVSKNDTAIKPKSLQNGPVHNADPSGPPNGPEKESLQNGPVQNADPSGPPNGPEPVHEMDHSSRIRPYPQSPCLSDQSAAACPESRQEFASTAASPRRPTGRGRVINHRKTRHLGRCWDPRLPRNATRWLSYAARA